MEFLGVLSENGRGKGRRVVQPRLGYFGAELKCLRRVVRVLFIEIGLELVRLIFILIR